MDFLALLIRGVRLFFRAAITSTRWAGRHAGLVRAKGAGGDTGMIRLMDLHAASIAGDTLITLGLAGTIFFAVPLGEARGKVALYLLITMVPFALLAPVVGPLLDHFRHGRRYALAVTMLGRAFLAWLISDNLEGFALYPAAFGVLALSRAYGVARAAAVPRLLPAGLSLSQATARGSVYGTIAGTIVLPLGLAAVWLGPEWPLRVASIIFLVGMVIALRLPPKADSEPPEAVPRPITAIFGLRRGAPRALDGALVIATVAGASSLRAVYGFLLLFSAFAIKGDELAPMLFGRTITDQAALAAVGAALGIGAFLATAAGTRLLIRRPLWLQSTGLVIVAGLAVLTVIRPTLGMLTLLSLITAAMSGIAKLTVDATIQERISERLRASAFAHSETILMLAWVAGGAIALIPLGIRSGLAVPAIFAVLAAIRAAWTVTRLRGERLTGVPAAPIGTPELPPGPSSGTDEGADRPAPPRAPEDVTPADPWAPPPRRPSPYRSGTIGTRPGSPDGGVRTAPGPEGARPPGAPGGPGVAGGAAGGGSGAGKTRWWQRRRRGPEPSGPAGPPPAPAPPRDTDLPPTRIDTPPTRVDEGRDAPPGFHVYRPSSSGQSRPPDPDGPGQA
ncbi:hypothetical protein J2S41_006404 [Catenuloplanes atrovinosus]|uniref:MFS transporter n=2 Tax=Catenuloplanes atrovinosus TaxID=137266 RepID=A0AAE4CCH1_9ACTN|nr:hypothetical protein [Catenuloplanes atrovinosus]